MIGLVNSEGILRFTHSLEGEDLGIWQEVDIPAGYSEGYVCWKDGEFITDWTNINNRLLAKIDYEAGCEREKFLTNIPGQDYVYSMKLEEARKYIETASSEGLTILNMESESVNVDVSVLADRVIQQFESARIKIAKIEAARINRKEAVLAAETLEEKENIANIQWDLVMSHEDGPLHTGLN